MKQGKLKAAALSPPFGRPADKSRGRQFIHADDLPRVFGFFRGETQPHGFEGIFQTTQVYTADEYVAFCGTHCDHLVIPEPYRSRFFAGLHEAVMAFGNRIEMLDSHVLMTVKKPA